MSKGLLYISSTVFSVKKHWS